MIALVPNLSLFTNVRVAKTAADAAKLVIETVTSKSYRTYGGLTIKARYDGRELPKEFNAVIDAITRSGVTVFAEKSTLAFEVLPVEEYNLDDVDAGYVLFPDAERGESVFYGTKSFIAEKTLKLVNAQTTLRVVNTNHDNVPHDEDALLKALPNTDSRLLIFNKYDEEVGRIQPVNER